MSKEKIRDLVICLIALTVLALVITTNAFAVDIESALGNDTNTTNEFTEIGNRNTSSAPANNTTNNTTNNVANKTNVANSNATNSKTNSNTNTTAIPYTGVDYSVVSIIAVCGISALYAYKKIRDYKSL